MTTTAPHILPGIHAGLSRAEYDAIDALNVSLLMHGIQRSMAHLRWEKDHPSEPSKEMVFGQAFHLACFEPAEFAKNVVQEPEYNARTNDGKAIRDKFAAENKGKLILTSDEMADLRGMQESIMAHKAARFLIDMSGDRECTVVWTDPETGVLCKGRLDKLTTNAVTIIDPKTTQCAAKGAFERSIITYGYHIRGAWYQDGVCAALGCDEPPNMGFVAIEKAPPYAVAAYELDAPALALGRLKYREAIREYAHCLKTGRWPGYSDKVEPISVPAWALRAENIPQESVS